MTQIRSSARLVATCMMLSSVALPAHAYSLPRQDENIWASTRPAMRPVGVAATERAPSLTVRPPLRGEAPIAIAELEEPHTHHDDQTPAPVDLDETVVASAEPEGEVEEAASEPAAPERKDPFEQMFFAGLGPFGIEPGAAHAVFAAEQEAKRLEEDGITDYAMLRGFVLPEDQIWRAPESASARAAREMRTAIRERLASRYDLDNGASGDIERFHAIAQGQSLKDWGAARPAVVQPAAMKVVEARFEAPAPAPVAPPAAPNASDLRGFLNSPAGIAALAQMDAAQISALTAMLREMEGREPSEDKPVVAAAPVSAAKSTVKGPGVPALSFRRIAGSAEPQVAETARTIGGNDNLLLRGWEVIDESGVISLYRDDAPGSKIQVREGMILGALGKVVAVDRSDDGVRVRFESGDEILGTSS